MPLSIYCEGIDYFLPKKIITNLDLEKVLDTSNEWIYSRTGILQRHVVSNDESVLSMAVAAINKLFDKMKIDKASIDFIVFVTSSGNSVFPSYSCQIQKELGLSNVIGFDIQAACSGFVYGMDIINNYLLSGSKKRALLVCSEAMSKVIDWQDRSTAILFGDGAAVALFSTTKKPGLVDIHLSQNTDSQNALKLNSVIGNYNTYNASSFIKMDGKSVMRGAIRLAAKTINAVISKANIDTQSIDFFVPHQANIRIINPLAKKFDIDTGKVITYLDKYANTSAASIPISLAKAEQEGKIRRGHLLLLTAFGAGMQAGSALMFW